MALMTVWWFDDISAFRPFAHWPLMSGTAMCEHESVWWRSGWFGLCWHFDRSHTGKLMSGTAYVNKNRLDDSLVSSYEHEWPWWQSGGLDCVDISTVCSPLAIDEAIYLHKSPWWPHLILLMGVRRTCCQRHWWTPFKRHHTKIKIV